MGLATRVGLAHCSASAKHLDVCPEMPSSLALQMLLPCRCANPLQSYLTEWCSRTVMGHCKAGGRYESPYNALLGSHS